MSRIIKKLKKPDIDDALTFTVAFFAIIGGGIFVCFMRGILKNPENWGIDTKLLQKYFEMDYSCFLREQKLCSENTEIRLCFLEF